MDGVIVFILLFIVLELSELFNNLLYANNQSVLCFSITYSSISKVISLINLVKSSLINLIYITPEYVILSFVKV